MNAYILTGGRSRRMGVSKSALYLERIASVAADVFERVFAVQRSGDEPLAIPTVFETAHDGDGPVFGVVAALSHSRADCFVLAVDYPLVTRGLLSWLRDHGGTPIWNGRPQPLCAVWSGDLLPRIEQRIAEGVFDLHGVGGREMIPEEELRSRFSGEPLLNVNTPAEREEAETLDGSEGFLSSR